MRGLFALILVIALPVRPTIAESGSTTVAAPAGAVAGASIASHLSGSDVRAELDRVQSLIQVQSQQLEEQRKQMERQQNEIEELHRQVSDALAAIDAGQRSVSPASAISRPSAAEQEQTAASTAALLNAGAYSPHDAGRSGIREPGVAALVSTVQVPLRGAGTESADAPLSFHFGQGSLTPGGWVDFTSYYRSTDVGSGLGTAFGAIPYSNTVAGGLSETRFTAQSSRISLRADEVFGKTRVFGYGEADFNGYLPSNSYVSTNSDSLRLRVYFSDVSIGKWEFLGGQSWSLLTPNRVGVSPFLSEIYNTLHLDTNYQVGLTYARQAQLRTVYHFNANVAMGLSVENPEQFSGNAPTFPALFSTTETDLNSSSGTGGGTATPTLHPDVIAKLSADAGWGHRKWHFETSGLLTPVEILTPASVTRTTTAKDIREGGGVAGSANLGVFSNLHLILTGFWSDGGGRYIGGLGPGFVVEQRTSNAAPFQAQLVHSGSGMFSAEWQANKNSVLEFTYSGAYFGRAFSTDPNTGLLVGYGFAGSANSNNRSIQEGTISTQTTLWKQRGYGAVQVITQSSYIARAPWYAAPDAPKNAHVFVGFANLRYVLP